MFRMTLAIAVLNAIYAFFQQSNWKEENVSILVSTDQLEIHWLLSSGSDWRTRVSGVNAFDYLFDEDKIVFSDVQRREINMISLRSGGAAKTLIENADCQTSEGLAVDWIHGNFYWIDNKENTINAYSFKSRSWKRIINENLNDLRAVEVDPFDGWLFWTSCGLSGKIQRSALDGSEHDVIFSTTTLCPGALAVDLADNVLYFYEQTNGLLGSVNYNEAKRRVILQKYRIGPADSLDVFQDSLYWTDGPKIYRASKYNGNSVKTIDSFGISSAMDVHVFHQDKQKSYFNVCWNTQCSHLCLPTRNNTRKAICACPEDMHLDDNYFQLCVDNTLLASNHGVSNKWIQCATMVVTVLVALVVWRSYQKLKGRLHLFSEFRN